MERLIRHVEKLLLQHDCVIIPDFGGFVLQNVLSEYAGEEHYFTPACKEIVFNPTLTHNDGLLAESYMQENAAVYDKAMSLIKQDVVEIKEILEDTSELNFGKVGKFAKEEDRLIFTPASDSGVYFSPQTFGLPAFHYLPLSARKPKVVPVAEVQPDTKTKKSGTIYIPVTKAFLRTVAAAAAAILLFLLISTPVRDVNKDSYSASFIPKEVMPKRTVDEAVTDAFNVSKNMSAYVEEPTKDISTNNEITVNIGSKNTKIHTEPSPLPVFRIEPESVTKETIEAKPEVILKTEENTKLTASTKTSASTSTKSNAKNSTKSNNKTNSKTSTKNSKANVAHNTPQYYVIIGSFNNRAQANAFIKRTKGTGVTNPRIVVADGHVRVYAKSFQTEESAEAYKKNLQQNTKHKQAWIYKGK